ncbi:MAG: hypothetical protein WBM66_02435 [Thiothrix litoralis]
MSESEPRISIWDAKNKLTYDQPLQPGNPLFVDIAPARGEFSLTKLYSQLNVDRQGQLHEPPRKQYILFTGHRGCGKSTELLRVAKYLHDPQRYYAVHLDCLETLDINNLKYSDVLLGLAAALLKQLEDEHGISVEQVHLTRLENWYKERVITHASLRNMETEIKAGVKTKAGLPWLVELFAELTNKISIGSTYRDELREVVRNNFTEFSTSFNQLIRAAEDKVRAKGLGQRILFTVDGTDRLDNNDAHKFFVEDVHQLTQIQSLFIYCAPIDLLHATNQLSANFGQPFRVPMLKVRDRDNQPIEANYQIVRNLVHQRVPPYLFDAPGTLDYLIGYSGGHPRDLLRLLNVAINNADTECIDLLAAERAVKEVANDYRRFIDSGDYARLVAIDNAPDAPDDFTDDTSSKMLYNLILLEYNDYFWKSHPVITTLPGYKKAALAAGT